MAWEIRNGKPVYYRKRRIGRQVVSEYVGSGRDAALLAQMDAATHATRETERVDAQAQQANDAALDKPLIELERLTNALVRAVLVSEGYHTHKGQWRRKRERTR